ncbi:MAG TPA: lipopolysaccharide heptosyltransferase II [Longimicrobiales bacterium]
MKFLLIRFSSIGDVILTTPLIRALRAAFPGATLHFATRRAFAPLLESNPCVDRVFTLPDDADGGLRALARTLRAERYDRVLDLHGTLRARLLRVLVPAPRWRGYRKYTLRRWALTRWKRNWFDEVIPVAERYFDAADGLGVRPDGGPPEVFPTPAAEAAAAAALRAAGIAAGAPYVALAPGAQHATKRWPEASWVELARRLAAAGLRVVVVGGPEDAEAGRRIAAAAGAANVAGALDLLGSAAVLAGARALASGDTGVMHLATAVGAPVVALFGPTVREFGFYPYRAPATVLERPLPCRPCSTHGGPACPLGHHACMTGIGVAEVAAAVEAAAAGRAPVG